MQKVIIIGGGFGGLTAAATLHRSFEVLLIDRQEECHFLPLLPDVIGRGLRAEFLTYPLKALAGRKFSFLKEQVTAVDLKNRSVSTSSGCLIYDYLIIASGSETNFYHNDALKGLAYSLDNASDAQRIKEALAGGALDTFVIAGGGYTGVEVATNIKTYLLQRHLKAKKVVMVERAQSILGPLPEWMKHYVSENLKMMDIEIACNTTVDKIESDRIALSDGRAFSRALCVWVAGVRTSDFVQRLSVQKNAQGRIAVDEFLRLDERVFVAGDASYVAQGGTFLRMAVQFSINEGRHAAKNIILSAAGKKLKKFKSVDLGYIIPMANNRSCARVMGIAMQGRIPTVLHYFMCIFRSYGWRNRMAIIKDLFWGR